MAPFLKRHFDTSNLLRQITRCLVAIGPAPLGTFIICFVVAETNPVVLVCLANFLITQYESNVMGGCWLNLRTIHNRRNLVESLLILGNGQTRVKIGRARTLGFDAIGRLFAEFEALGTVTGFEVALGAATFGSCGAL